MRTLLMASLTGRGIVEAAARRREEARDDAAAVMQVDVVATLQARAPRRTLHKTHARPQAQKTRPVPPSEPSLSLHWLLIMQRTTRADSEQW